MSGLTIDKNEVEALSFIRRNTQNDSIILSDNDKLGINNYCYYMCVGWYGS